MYIAKVGLNSIVQYPVVHVKRYLSLGNLFLLLTEPGGRRHWELVTSVDGVVEPGLGPADAPQEEVGACVGVLSRRMTWRRRTTR